MNYVGIDIHKKYSVLWTQGERGSRLKEARIEEGHCWEDYARFFGALEGPSRAVLEACYGLLEEIAEVEEVVLAHPWDQQMVQDAAAGGKLDRLQESAHLDSLACRL